jgi:hypothetical protein
VNWNRLIQALLLVRAGQELGTDGPLAQTVRDLIDLLIRLGNG